MWSSEILLKMMLSCLLWCVALLNCFWVFKIKGNFFFVYRIFCLNCSWLFHWSLFVLNTLWERQSPRLLHSLLGHTRGYLKFSFQNYSVVSIERLYSKCKSDWSYVQSEKDQCSIYNGADIKARLWNPRKSYKESWFIFR